MNEKKTKTFCGSSHLNTRESRNFPSRITESLRAAWSENGERRRLIERNQWAFNLKWKKCTQNFLCENRELYGSFRREMKINWTQTEKAKISGTVEMCGGSGGGKARERISTVHVLVRRGSRNHMLWKTRGFSEDEEKLILLIRCETSWHHKSLRGDL